MAASTLLDTLENDLGDRATPLSGTQLSFVRATGPVKFGNLYAFNRGSFHASDQGQARVGVVWIVDAGDGFRAVSGVVTFGFAPDGPITLDGLLGLIEADAVLTGGAPAEVPAGLDEAGLPGVPAGYTGWFARAGRHMTATL